MAKATNVNDTVTLKLTKREAQILHALTGKVNIRGAGHESFNIYGALSEVLDTDYTSVFSVEAMMDLGEMLSTPFLSITLEEQ